MTRLQPVDVHPVGGNATTDIMFIRGKHDDGSGNAVLNTVPIGFQPDGNNANATYTEWTFKVNDPYLTGWTVKNIGNKNGSFVGDVIVAWFKTLDESFDGSATDERYLMVVNGLTDPTGTAADGPTAHHNGLPVRLGRRAPHGIERLNPDTGLVEFITLTPIGSGKYRWSFDLDRRGRPSCSNSTTARRSSA